MNDINEVRERLARLAEFPIDNGLTREESADLRALIDDHARLQADAERLNLEQFRDAVLFWISETEKLPDAPPKRGLEAYGNRLLALIDGRAAKGAEVSNGQ